MSKLTREEAAKRLDSLQHMSALSNMNEKAIRMGAAALRYQERHRWRKLEKEKPPESGWYWIVTRDILQNKPYVDKAYWGDDEQEWAYAGIMTHWAFIDLPSEVEDDQT